MLWKFNWIRRDLHVKPSACLKKWTRSSVIGKGKMLKRSITTTREPAANFERRELTCEKFDVVHYRFSAVVLRGIARQVATSINISFTKYKFSVNSTSLLCQRVSGCFQDFYTKPLQIIYISKKRAVARSSSRL